MDNEHKSGFWAVLPASVRYDDRLIPNAKLLYAEITSLCSREGYCWAENAYFAALYKVSERSIRTWIEQLQSLGYVYIHIAEKPSKASQQTRRIYIDRDAFHAVEAGNSADERWKKSSSVGPTLEENFPTLEENFQPLQYISINNNNTCSDACGVDVGKAKKQDHKPDRFEGFWKFYKASVPAGIPVGDKSRARKAWNKLAPSDKLIDAMGLSLKAQCSSDWWRRGIGIPHASTWINGRRWESDVETGDAGQAPAREERIGWD